MVNSKTNNSNNGKSKQAQQQQNASQKQNVAEVYPAIVKSTVESNRSKQKSTQQYSSENVRKPNQAKDTNKNSNNGHQQQSPGNQNKPLKQRNIIVENFGNNKNNNNNNSSANKSKPSKQYQQVKSPYRDSSNSFAKNSPVVQPRGQSNENNVSSKGRSSKSYSTTIVSNNNSPARNPIKNSNSFKKPFNAENDNGSKSITQLPQKTESEKNVEAFQSLETTNSPSKQNPAELSSAALNAPCAKCSSHDSSQITLDNTVYKIYEPVVFTNKQYRKSKSYMGSSHSNSRNNETHSKRENNKRNSYYRSFSDRRNSFDRNYALRNKDFVPIVQPSKPILSSSNIAAVIADVDKLVIIERLGKGRTTFPIMQCGTLDAPESSYHRQRSMRMDAYQIDDGFHSDGGTETPPPSPSSGSSIASTSDHGSLESVDTGGTQRLAVLSFEQVRKLHNVMDEKVAIHGRGNFPTLEVTLKDLVNSVRRKLEADVASGGAGVIVKDIRLNGGAASHVLAPEDQPYNDLDLIYAIELSSPRVFDRVKTAVLNTLLDLLPEGVSKRRIMPCALKEAYVGKMVKVNNNNDGDRWSLFSLGNSPGHKNVELKFVDTMRRQFEFSVDSFQIVLDSLLLFYDCAALPISENFYPTVVGESVYGDFQEALYHLQKKLISTRQPEEIRGGGLLKYCNLLVRNYKPVDPQRIKNLERYMCSRFFIDFPDINTQTVKLEAYLRNHFWGVEEEPLQYEYLMHLREVVEQSTVCLMSHERRQTLLLIQTLAAQVRQRQAHQQHQDHYQQPQHLVEMQQHHHQQHHHHHHHQQQTQHQTTAILVAQPHNPQAQQQQQSQQHQQQQQPQQPQTTTLYLQTSAAPQNTTLCCTLATNGIGNAATTASNSSDQNSQSQAQTSQQCSSTVTSAPPPQTIQIQHGPGGLIYANGVYYAPVIPTTICTCNSTWLST